MTNKTYKWVPLLLTMVVGLVPFGLALAGDPAETVVIDSIEYQVSEFWCGQLLDSSEIALPIDLVQLPQELTYEEYRIYVLPQARDALVVMAEAALKDSIELIADSGYRSLSYQRLIVKNRLAAGDSFEEIQTSVAPPGYSEHHTGRALDLCPSEARFAFTDTYCWLTEHAAEYGFYETLPENPAAPLTWESWHWTWREPPPATNEDLNSSDIKPLSDSADN